MKVRERWGGERGYSPQIRRPRQQPLVQEELGQMRQELLSLPLRFQFLGLLTFFPAL